MTNMDPSKQPAEHGATVLRRRHTGWLVAVLIAVAVIAGVYFRQGSAHEDAAASGVGNGDRVASAAGEAG